VAPCATDSRYAGAALRGDGGLVGAPEKHGRRMSFTWTTCRDCHVPLFFHERDGFCSPCHNDAAQRWMRLLRIEASYDQFTEYVSWRRRLR